MRFFRWLRSIFFTEIEVQPVPPPMRNMKLAILRGHIQRQQGAWGQPPMRMSEWAFNEKYIEPEMLLRASELGIEAAVFDKSVFTRPKYPNAAKAADEWIGDTPGCAIELHFNSATPAAYGTETLYDGKPMPENKILAEIVQRKMCEVFGRTKEWRNGGRGDRGLKFLQPRQAGHYAMAAHYKPSCLVEPTFAGSNVAEAKLLYEKRVAYARCLVDAALEFLESRKGE